MWKELSFCRLFGGTQVKDKTKTGQYNTVQKRICKMDTEPASQHGRDEKAKDKDKEQKNPE
jgi:hypothetical protein